MHLFFDLTHFRELGQNYRNILVRFLVQIKTLKFASQINWPLLRTYYDSWLFFLVCWWTDWIQTKSGDCWLWKTRNFRFRTDISSQTKIRQTWPQIGMHGLDRFSILAELPRFSESLTQRTACNLRKLVDVIKSIK